MYNNIPSNYCLVYALHIRHGLYMENSMIEKNSGKSLNTQPFPICCQKPIKNCPLFQQSSSLTYIPKPSSSSFLFSTILCLPFLSNSPHTHLPSSPRMSRCLLPRPTSSIAPVHTGIHSTSTTEEN